MTMNPDELDRKIKEMRADEKRSEPGKDGPPPSGGRQAAAAGMEFISAVAVGGFLGYLIDQWLGTKPWGMVVLFILGSAAGFVNIYRSATGQDYRVGMGTLDKTKNKKTGEGSDSGKSA